MDSNDDYTRDIVAALRESIFRDLGDNLENDIAVGRIQYVRERRRNDSIENVQNRFDIIAKEDVARERAGSSRKASDIDLQVSDYSPAERTDIAKLTIRRQFIEPASFIVSITETLQLDDVSAIVFVDPVEESRPVSLSEYIAVLKGAEAEELQSALDEDF